MYNGIGLQTPRGSGTNGYIQSNKFFVKPRNVGGGGAANSSTGFDVGAGGVKKANKEILEHDRKRQIELKLLVLRETLEEQGYTEFEVDEKVNETRKELEAEAQQLNQFQRPPSAPSKTRFSDTQTHQVAARKEKQLESMRAALGIERLEDSSKLVGVHEQKQEDDALRFDDEESDPENQRHQEKDSKHGDGNEESERIRKGNQIAKDHKDADSEDESEEGEIKKDDRRVFTSGRDKDIGKGKYSLTSDSDDSEHYERKKGHKKVTRRHDPEEDFDKSSKKSTNKVLDKQAKGSNRRETLSSDSEDSYASKEISRKHADVKQKRHDIDSESDLDNKQLRKQQTNSRRLDSDNLKLGRDYLAKNKGKEMLVENKSSGSRHKTNYSDSDNEKHYNSSRKKHDRSRRYNSDREQSESDDAKRKVRKEMEKRSKPYGRDDANESKKNEKDEKLNRRSVAYAKGNTERSNRRHDSDCERSESDVEKRKVTKEMEKHSKSYRRDDANGSRRNEKDENLNRKGNAAYDKGNTDRSTRRYDSDSEQSDHDDEKRKGRKEMEKWSKSYRKDDPNESRSEKDEKLNRKTNVAYEKGNTDRSSRRYDSDSEQSDRDDEKTNVRKEMEKQSKPYRRDGAYENVKDEKDEKLGRKTSDAYEKGNTACEGVKKGRLEVQGGLLPDGKKQDIKRGRSSSISDDRHSSESDFSSDNSDSFSDDSRDHSRAKHSSRKADVADKVDDRKRKSAGEELGSRSRKYARYEVDIDNKRNETSGSRKRGEAYDYSESRQNKDADGNRRQETIKKTEVKELPDTLDSKYKSGGLKEEKKPERDGRSHTTDGRRSSDDQRMDNRNKQELKEKHQIDDKHRRRHRTEDEQSYDDNTKRRRHGDYQQHSRRDDYERNHGEDSGHHRRRHS